MTLASHFRWANKPKAVKSEDSHETHGGDRKVMLVPSDPNISDSSLPSEREQIDQMEDIVEESVCEEVTASSSSVSNDNNRRSEGMETTRPTLNDDCRLPPPEIRSQLMSIDEDEENQTKEYDEIHCISSEQLKAVASVLKCPKRKCKKNSIEIVTKKDRWDTTFEAVCNSCNSVLNQAPPKLYGEGKKHQQFTHNNLREVFLSLNNGIGRAGLRKMGGFIGGAPLSAGSYNRYSKYIFKCNKKHFMKMQAKAHKFVYDFYVKKLGAVPDENNVINIDVSFDGTWLTRGQKSHVGVGFVIEVFTGTVIDFEVISNYCKTCSENKEKPHNCGKNFDGKSGAMEAEQAVRMWSRSENLGFRYAKFVSDGDSSAYKAVCQLNNGKGPYLNVKVSKQECINHAEKRMGYRLMKLKKELSEITKTKTGKLRKISLLPGRNLLTQKLIEYIQGCYGKALRSHTNTSVDIMRRAVWATYFHMTSSDKHPGGHKMCPKGAESWCFYNRAQALGEEPSSHDTRKNTARNIPKELIGHIRQVFKDMSDPELLKRCLPGWTQNANESIHSRLWMKCPKVKFFGLKRVTFAAEVTTLEHNFGYERSNLLTSLFGTSSEIRRSLKSLDKERSKSQKPKNRRKKKKEKSEDYEGGAFQNPQKLNQATVKEVVPPDTLTLSD